MPYDENLCTLPLNFFWSFLLLFPFPAMYILISPFQEQSTSGISILMKTTACRYNTAWYNVVFHTGTHFTNGFSTVVQIRWKLLFCSHRSCRKAIAIKFCAGHDSWAIVACAKYGAGVCDYISLSYTKKNFPSSLKYNGKGSWNGPPPSSDKNQI